MGYGIPDTGGAFFAENGVIIYDNRGHKEISKRFHSDAEA